MNELHRALGEISSIRRQMARSAEFRGYGPATLAATAALAAGAALVQAAWVPAPMAQPRAYLAVWIGTAIVSAVLIGVQTYTRARRIHSDLADEMIQMAVEQFLPSVGAGALFTVVLVHAAPQVLWLLPGVWQMIYGLGIFSSCRFLPRPMIAAGGWYLFCGLGCIALGDERALSPWTMGVAYAAGQTLVAGILLLTANGAGDEGWR